MTINISELVREEFEKAFQERVGTTRGERAAYEAELVAAHQNALNRVRGLEGVIQKLREELKATRSQNYSLENEELKEAIGVRITELEKEGEKPRREDEEGLRMMTVQRDVWKARSDGYSQEHDRLVMELAQERWKVIKLEEEVDRINSPPIAPGSSEANVSSDETPTQPTSFEETTQKSYVQQGENAAMHQKWIHPVEIVQPGDGERI